MNQLDTVLNKNERLVWSGKPKFWPFILSYVSVLSIVFVLVLLLAIGIRSSATGPNDISGASNTLILSVIAIIILSTALIVQYWRVVFYGVTDKRVIFQSGIIGRNFTFVDYDKIENAIVNIGIINKIFKTGSIRIFSGRMGGRYGETPMYDSLSNVTNPYDVFKLFEKTEYDVKTDINYPNKYRPEDNPGYNTKYDPK